MPKARIRDARDRPQEAKMRKSLAMFLPLLLAVATAASGSLLAERKLLVRVTPYSDEAWTELPATMDVVGKKAGEWIDVAVRRSELDELLKLDASISVLIDDLESYQSDRAAEYHTYPEMISILQGIELDYPDIADLFVIGMTNQFNFIYALKISDNVAEEEDESEVLFLGLHHAREWPTMEICLFYADTLTSGYGVEPEITEMVDETEIFIVPCVNPDGYIYCHDQGHDWRKNRRYFPESGTWGVDLNRNYAGSTNGVEEGEWGSIQGNVSHEPSSEVYCGPGPISELETVAVRNLFDSHDFIFAITYHTYGELVMYPWGYTYSSAPDATTLNAIGSQMASLIESQYGGGSYWPQQSSALYPTTGDFTDWAYGYNLYSKGGTTLAYTIEACASFQPPESYLDQIVRENFDAAMYVMQIADSMMTELTPCVMPPVISEMFRDKDGEFTVSWVPQNPRAEATQFQLDQMSGYEALLDDGEEGTSLWSLDGFSLTTSRYHSPSHSFWSTTQQPNAAVAMISAYPVDVIPGQSLEFWTYYSIESDYDYAFVEVSRDGREWDILDSFTGSTNFWTYKSYGLSDYENESIYIKFRYITDDYTQNQGFFVDDISPTPSFSEVVTLSDSITDTTYFLTGVERGRYFYRVKGYNPERGWGVFSQLEDIHVNPGVDWHREKFPAP